MHAYWAFGLTIQSEIEFPEMHPFVFEGLPDVILDAQGPSTEMDGCVGDRQQYDTTDHNRFELYVKNVAYYRVEYGRLIHVQIHAGADPGAVRLFCLSNAFAALLYQRGQIPLHASGIKIPSGTALFMGDSGAGKSSLLLKLGTLGWNIFTDDVCVPLQLGVGMDLLVHSSYPMIKSWPDTLERLKMDTTAAHRLRKESDKLGIYFNDQFDTAPLKPQFVFLIEKSDSIDQLVVTHLSGKALFSRLSMQVYRGEHLYSADRKVKMFQVLAKLASQTTAYAIERPANQDSFDEMALAITQKINV
jgi:hypothetical protein